MGVIYQIAFDGGSRSYIGSAHRLPYRRASHLSLLRKGTHHCRALQNAFAKYGEASIRWTVLEDVGDRSMLIEREQDWLDRSAGKLYNRSPTAASRLGATMSAEACAKISASLRGNKYRKGIPFSPEERKRIGDIIRAEYASGKRKPSPQPQNLRAYNDAYRRGERNHPKVNLERDAQIVEHYRATNSLKETGAAFGLSGSAIGYAVRRHNRRTSCVGNQGT